MTSYVIGIVVGISGLLVLYTKVIFDYATIKATLITQTTILVKIETLLNGHDEKLENLERRLTIIETQHSAHHRKGDL